MKDKAYEIAIIFKYDGYQRELASMVYRFFDKKIGLGTTSKTAAKKSEVNSKENKCMQG